MNENEFELDGKVYVAVVADGKSCSGCALKFRPCYSTEYPYCIGSDRKDGRDVIFVEKPQ